jgi:hypothetical protein
VPTAGQSLSGRRSAAIWEGVPDTRIAVGQAGIHVKDDNELLGRRLGERTAFHAYFRRAYGFVNLSTDSRKISVSRNELVMDEAARAELTASLPGCIAGLRTGIGGGDRRHREAQRVRQAGRVFGRG